MSLRIPASLGTGRIDGRSWREVSGPGRIRPRVRNLTARGPRATPGPWRTRFPGRALEKAVRGMLPKGPLGYAMLKKLKCYAGPAHPHSAQQPKALDPVK